MVRRYRSEPQRWLTSESEEENYYIKTEENGERELTRRAILKGDEEGAAGATTVLCAGCLNKRE